MHLSCQHQPVGGQIGLCLTYTKAKQGNMYNLPHHSVVKFKKYHI